MTLSENISSILNHVRALEKEAGREENSVKVIAVTKYSTPEDTRAFVEAGMHDLAENRVDKLLAKQEALSDMVTADNKDKIHWHLIGHLQSRKVRQIINDVDTFHALDSISLAKEISKRAEHEISCLLEVNISGEESKYGFAAEELEAAVNEISQYENIRIDGLMTMAPIDADDAALTEIFSKAHELQQKIEDLKIENVPCHELSMGMSRDYHIAIKEGATMIRIGRDFLK